MSLKDSVARCLTLSESNALTIVIEEDYDQVDVYVCVCVVALTVRRIGGFNEVFCGFVSIEEEAWAFY